MEKTSRLQCQRTKRRKEKLGANTTNTSTRPSCVTSSCSRSQLTLSERREHHGQLPGPTSTQTLASSPTANLKSPMNLTSVHDCGRKLEHLQQTHTEMERTCAQKPSVVHNYTARQTHNWKTAAHTSVLARFRAQNIPQSITAFSVTPGQMLQAPQPTDTKMFLKVPIVRSERWGPIVFECSFVLCSVFTLWATQRCC